MYINGEKKEFNKDLTIEELLEELDIDKEKVVVEVNKDIIPKDQYNLKLNSEDRVEIVSFVGGG